MVRYRERKKELYLLFTEKAYEREPRKELWICMMAKGASAKYLNLVKHMYMY